MFWEITDIKKRERTADDENAEGRFVLHRHRDTWGPHLDLRLENGGSLVGWRIAGENLEPGRWATEKMPHPLDWLTRDGDARRELEGEWRWQKRDDNRCSVALTMGKDVMEITLEKQPDLTVETACALAGTARAHHLSPASLPGLVEDGLTARAREIARFCALSRALDGDGFDETAWRSLFEGMTLREIGERLARVEVRHDRLHPPAPVSRPEPLAGGEPSPGTARAFQIINS